MHFIGLDLTDPYAKRPRDVDVALVDEFGNCSFLTLPPHNRCADTTEWLAPITSGPKSRDTLIIDGPLGLSNLGKTMRDCERVLRAAGKTGDMLPVPGTRPFAGFVRGSVELADALCKSGWKPVFGESRQAHANLFEAYPGGTWRRLAGSGLPKKSTAMGLAQRLALLCSVGLTFRELPMKHDQLDAALCAWLGWTLRTDPDRIEFVGTPMRSPQQLREGVILQVLHR